MPRIFEIWKARPGARLVSEHEEASHAKQLLRMLDWQGRGGFGCWVWEDSNGEVLGWQSLMPCRNNPAVTDTMAEASMYVHADAWGKGIGTKLLQHALAVADRACIEHVMGVVSSQNDPMLRIAKRLGFRVVGELAPSPKAPHRGTLSVLFYRCSECQDDDEGPRAK